MNPSTVVQRWRRNLKLISDLVARPAFQAAFNQMQTVSPSRYRRSFESNALNAMKSLLCSENRLLLITGGRLCAILDRTAVGERQRRNPQLIGDLVARPAFLHAFQTAVKQLQAVFPSRYRRSFESNALNAMRSRVCSEDRLLLITGGRLCAMLAQRLLCFNGECAVRDALRLSTSALSRRNFFRNSSATCVATLVGHSNYIRSVAFHPTAPLLATGSEDKTVRLWQ